MAAVELNDLSSDIALDFCMTGIVPLTYALHLQAQEAPFGHRVILAVALAAHAAYIACSASRI